MKIIFALLIFSVINVFAQFRITIDNLKEGKLFKGSKSSNGVGLYCVHHGLTTGTSMVLLDESKNKVLASIPIRTTYSVPRNKKGWLTVKWNPNGSMVSIHDSLSKHSRILIYRRSNSGLFEIVNLPNMMTLEALDRIGLNVDDIVSSGQEPSNWSKNNLLFVNYRFKSKGGKLYQRTFPIYIDDQGVYKSQ